MPTTECATDIALNHLQHSELPDDHSQLESGGRTSDGASKPLKGLFFGFAATVTVGLALASWYVGARIVSTDEAPSSSNSTPLSSRSAIPAPQTVPALKAAPEPSVALYLQVGSIGPRQDASFVRSLDAKGYQVHRQARDGSQDGDSRILIGPFSTHSDLEQAQRKLESTGVLAIETAY